MHALEPANIVRINELFALHQPEGQQTEGHPGCMAFVVDDRYVYEPEGEFEMRLGISFGLNPYSAQSTPTFLAAPILPDQHVFALHNIATKDKRLTICDSWLNAFPGGDSVEESSVIEEAQRLLASISDDEYRRLCMQSPENRGSVERCSLAVSAVVETEAL